MALKPPRVSNIKEISTYLTDIYRNLTATGTDISTEGMEVKGDLTLAANQYINPAPGNMYNIAAGKTLTIYSPANILSPPNQQIFTGSGTVAFTVGGIIYADWYGFSTSATAANNTIYFNKAVDGMIAGAKLIVNPGTYPLGDNTVFDPPDECSLLSMGAFTHDGTGTALTIGDASGATTSKYYKVEGIKISSTARDHTSGRIGVLIRNVGISEIHIDRVHYHEYGIKCQGTGSGGYVGYNKIFLNYLYDNKYSLMLTADDSGWCNENTFYGGELSWNTDPSGFKHIWIDYYSTNTINNNKFWGQSLEAYNTPTTAAYGIYCEGRYNEFYGLRYELDTASDNVYHAWLTANSVSNSIVGGYNLDDATTIGGNYKVHDLGSYNFVHHKTMMDLEGARSPVLKVCNRADDTYAAIMVYEKTKTTAGWYVTGAGQTRQLGDLYINGLKVLGVRNTGWTTMAGTAVEDNSGINADTITASDANIQALAKAVKAIMDALIAHGLIGT